MSETLPPTTLDELRADLQNETFSAYVYIGASEDEGWENAQLCELVLPRLHVFLVSDPLLVDEWTGHEEPAGIVFGWGDEPHRLLDQDEASDFKTVLRACIDARA